MKKIQKLTLTLLLSLFAAAPMAAQEVNSTIMLEMAPYRHVYNPAFEPITDGYFYFPVLSHMQVYGGNNSLTMKDVIINKGGQTMWTLNPNSGVNPLKAFRKNTLIRSNAQMAILGFGFRLKNNGGYLHINIDANVDAGVTLPKGIFDFALGGGMKDRQGENTFNLKSLGMNTQAYLSLGVGYSKQQTDQWTWGLKVKLLDGVAYAGMRQRKLDLTASPEEWALRGNGYMQIAGPFTSLPTSSNYDAVERWADSDFLPSSIGAYLKPSGYGAAFDLGATYQPHEMVKISFSLTDIGAIYWTNGRRYNYTVDGVFTGVGDLNSGDYYNNADNSFNTDALVDTITSRLEDIYKTAIHDDGNKKGFLAPLTMKFNVGVDAYFCDNILGLGLYNRAMLYNARVYDELTIGAAVRPCSWFNFGVTYSFLNGKWDNLGAAFGLRGGPFALTVAADYVPMTWARNVEMGGKAEAIPYKSKGFNVEMGLSIVWGWKPKDNDKDGVLDRWDMCPKTPKEVYVDELGCPLDTDGDGVPDYLDNCPATPAAAYGLIDDHGCPIDTDGDGVPDYLDECPGTDSVVYGYVDEKGCPLDTDGDGVPDYKDLCPNTPAAAIGYVDENGCTLDTDEDGVPDYRDRCPNTPAEAIGLVDEFGCPLDTDGDGVPDYLDECPNTPAAARAFVDEKGCELDSDGDGVPDYQDLCPHQPGPKDNKGCPAVKKEVTNIFKKAMQGIQFETGKAVIKKSSNGILDQVAKVFIENPTWVAEVQGHTDNVGKPEMNMTLSDKRANAVRDYLIGKGVAADHLTAKGYGDTMPIESNKTAKGRTLNRRVEFSISYEQKIVETIKQFADPVPADSVAADSVAAPVDSTVVLVSSTTQMTLEEK